MVVSLARLELQLLLVALPPQLPLLLDSPLLLLLKSLS